MTAENHNEKIPSGSGPHTVAEDPVLAAFRKAEAGAGPVFGMRDDRRNLYEKMAALLNKPPTGCSIDPEMFKYGFDPS